MYRNRSPGSRLNYARGGGLWWVKAHFHYAGRGPLVGHSSIPLLQGVGKSSGSRLNSIIRGALVGHSSIPLCRGTLVGQGSISLCREGPLVGSHLNSIMQGVGKSSGPRLNSIIQGGG